MRNSKEETDGVQFLFLPNVKILSSERVFNQTRIVLREILYDNSIFIYLRHQTTPSFHVID